ncbi:9873_t:CDS:2 [Ambispora gerdemannii]|uniref:gamma-glutamylcyclotransferase n=1 Tax=Ambispora gerdemannii TaxID=144530 RepID=A0A9N8VHV1_9GLOM|nr:9873_t:CDS:2 [Ambispora gerdemannii]
MEPTTENTPLVTTTNTSTSDNEDKSTSYGSIITYIGNDEIASLNESHVIQNNPEEDEDENYLWYLAYGSDMNKEIFVGRRGIKPKLARACHVPNYFLSFDYEVNPYMEPTFANILRFSPPLPTDGSHPIITQEYAWEVHRRCNTGVPFEWDETNPMDSLPPMLQGVLYKITKKQYQRIVINEGGWGWDDVLVGYKDIDVECMTYDREKIIAKTLIVKPECVSNDLQISERYHNILKEGAREHNMDVNYQTYLATKIMPYKITTTRKKIGKLTTTNEISGLNESHVIQNNPEEDEDENYLWYLEYAWEVHRRCNTGVPFEWDETKPMGGWGWDDVPFGYKDIDVECVRENYRLQISERRCTEHNIDVNYQTYLATKIMPYKITTTRKKALFLVLFFPFLFIVAITMKIGMRVPRRFAVYKLGLREGIHMMDDRLFELYFGSGNNNLDV